MGQLMVGMGRVGRQEGAEQFTVLDQNLAQIPSTFIQLTTHHSNLTHLF